MPVARTSQDAILGPAPDISIVVVTYNQARYIRQCLDSILAQDTSYKIEILVGEDGSNDGTAEIVDEYAEKHPELFKVFHRSRSDVIYIKGHPTNRYNILQTLAQAKGRFLATLDGDDYYTCKSKLQSQAAFLEKNSDFSACYHDFRIVDEAGEPTREPSNIPADHTITVSDIAIGRNLPASTFLSVNDQGSVPSWFTRLAYADWALLLWRIGSGRLGNIKSEMSAYRVHAASMFSTTPLLKKLQGERGSAAIFIRYWPDQNLARFVGDREFRCLIRLSREYRRLGRNRPARIAFQRAALLYRQKKCHRTPTNTRRILVEAARQLFRSIVAILFRSIGPRIAPR